MASSSWLTIMPEGGGFFVCCPRGRELWGWLGGWWEPGRARGLHSGLLSPPPPLTEARPWAAWGWSCFPFRVSCQEPQPDISPNQPDLFMPPLPLGAAPLGLCWGGRG